MILQTDSSMPQVIQRWGCYLFSLLWHAGRHRFAEYTAQEILDVYKSAMATGIIGKEVYDTKGLLTDGCYITDPLALMSIAGYKLTSIRKELPSYRATGPEVEILVYHRDADTPTGSGNPVHTHFVAGIDGKVAFDPMGKSLTVRWGQLQSKRILA